MSFSVCRFDRDSHAAMVADRWKAQYSKGGKGKHWRSTASGCGGEVYDQLIALAEKPKADEVDKIIGNNSWTHFMCDGCYKQKPHGIMIGTQDREIHICDECSLPLKEALS